VQQENVTRFDRPGVKHGDKGHCHRRCKISAVGPHHRRNPSAVPREFTPVGDNGHRGKPCDWWSRWLEFGRLLARLGSSRYCNNVGSFLGLSW